MESNTRKIMSKEIEDAKDHFSKIITEQLERIERMKKDAELWQPEDLFVVVTDDFKGYLAVNESDQWNYLNFEQGRFILSEIPDEISFTHLRVRNNHQLYKTCCFTAINGTA